MLVNERLVNQFWLTQFWLTKKANKRGIGEGRQAPGPRRAAGEIEMTGPYARSFAAGFDLPGFDCLSAP